jgi:K(+)-stimulated pyrophosphate-energized sodium pump
MSAGDDQHDVWRIVIALVATAIIVTVIYISKQRETVMGDAAPPAAPAAPASDPVATA